MKALVVSDLHLEFSTLDLDVSGIDIVILAGDIHLGTRAFPWIQAQCAGLPVIYVPGNHEFYRGEYSRVLRDLRAAADKTPRCQDSCRVFRLSEFIIRGRERAMQCHVTHPSARKLC